jgi:hypothetical protein
MVNLNLGANSAFYLYVFSLHLDCHAEKKRHKKKDNGSIRLRSKKEVGPKFEKIGFGWYGINNYCWSKKSLPICLIS